MAWVSDLTGALWQGVVNMLASFSPLLALLLGLSLAFWFIGKLVDLVFRRGDNEEGGWW